MTIRAFLMALGLMFTGIFVGAVIAWQVTMPTPSDEAELQNKWQSARRNAEAMAGQADGVEADNRRLRAELERVRKILAPLPAEVVAEMGSNPDPWTIFNYRREQILTHRQRRTRIIKALDEWARTVDAEHRSLAQISPAELGLSDAEFQTLRQVLGR